MSDPNLSAFYKEPTHDEIALVAFLAWEKDGRQSGREMNYWLHAETHLRTARQKKAEDAAKIAARPWPRTASTGSARRAPVQSAPKASPAPKRTTAPISKRTARSA